MSRLIHTIFTVVLLLATAGCNDYVFVDSSPLPDETEIKVEGSEGYAEVLIDTDGLLGLQLQNPCDSLYLTYLDKNSNPIPLDSPISEVAGINYYDVWREFNVRIYGSYLNFYSYFNCTGEECRVVVLLFYAEGDTTTTDMEVRTKKVTFIVGAGPRLEEGFVDYGNNPQIVPDSTYSQTTIYRNDTPETQRVWLYPYRDIPATAMIEPTEKWAEGAEVNMPLPLFWHDEWWLHDDDYHPTLGTPFKYEPNDADMPATVEVAPNTTVKITRIISFTKYSNKGKIDFFNRVTQQWTSTDFKCEVIYPTGYKLTVEPEN